MRSLSRRAVLRSIGLIGLGAALRPDALEIALAQGEPVGPPPQWNGEPLGRITGEYMNARAEPSLNAEVSAQLPQDTVVRVRRVVEGQTVFLYNNLWLETDHGYLFSSYVQPMRYHLPNPPQADLGSGRWAEVTVPVSRAYWDPNSTGVDRWVDDLYYSSIVRVSELVPGQDGKHYYRVEELYQSYYMRATHLRILPPEALAPISPHIAPSAKRIEVDLSRQLLTAYERDTPVLVHRVASGLPDHATPTGTFYVVDKRPGERMVGGRAAAEEDKSRYNLGGVPFVCYFTWDWVALHGTYWHNDYGQPHSHGCVNVPPHIARWIWRWTTPYADYDEFVVRPSNALDGTRVIVY